MEFWWNMNGILVEYEWNFGGLSMGYWWNMNGILVVYQWNIGGI